MSQRWKVACTVWLLLIGVVAGGMMFSPMFSKAQDFFTNLPFFMLVVAGIGLLMRNLWERP